NGATIIFRKRNASSFYAFLNLHLSRAGQARTSRSNGVDEQRKGVSSDRPPSMLGAKCCRRVPTLWTSRATVLDRLARSLRRVSAGFEKSLSPPSQTGVQKLDGIDTCTR